MITPLQQLQQLLISNQLQGIIISKPSNIRYLSNLSLSQSDSREAFVFVAANKAILYHSPLLKPSNLPTSWHAVAMTATNTKPTLLELFANAKTIGIETRDLRVSELNRFEEMLPNPQFEPIDTQLEKLRLTKAKKEVEKIQAACRVTASTMSWVIQQLTKPSFSSISDGIEQELGKLIQLNELSELKLAQLIEFKLKQLGATNLAFPVLVAFDQNSSIPHHYSNQTLLQPDSVVMLDFGAKYEGYCADMTRTIKLGKTDSKFDNVASIVTNAFNQTISLLASFFQPLSGNLVDNTARQIISDSGYGDYFIHSIGHGLGLDIHEPPHLSPNNQDVLKPGMIITIEPGIYLPNQFGYRHEDTLLITKTGYQNLTNPSSND